jgi:KDO2-lipid IV(A) lauroyltransferase
MLQKYSAQGGPAILFSGHIGNWELLPPICAAHGIALSSAYRPPANPLVDRIIAKMRRNAVGADLPMFPKGRAGAKGAMAHLMKGGYLGLLIDQKMNDGIFTAAGYWRPSRRSSHADAAS